MPRHNGTELKVLLLLLSTEPFLSPFTFLGLPFLYISFLDDLVTDVLPPSQQTGRCPISRRWSWTSLTCPCFGDRTQPHPDVSPKLARSQRSRSWPESNTPTLRNIPITPSHICSLSRPHHTSLVPTPTLIQPYASTLAHTFDPASLPPKLPPLGSPSKASTLPSSSIPSASIWPFPSIMTTTRRRHPLYEPCQARLPSSAHSSPSWMPLAAESDSVDLPSTTIPIALDRMDVMRRDRPPHADSGPNQVGLDVLHLAPTRGDRR